MSKRQIWFLLAVLCVIAVAKFAHAGMLGGVGQLMGPTSGAGGPVPGGGFAILTEAGNNLATETGDILVLESAP